MQCSAANAVVADAQTALGEGDVDLVRASVAHRVAECLADDGSKGACAAQIARQLTRTDETDAETRVGICHIGEQGGRVRLLRERHRLEEAVNAHDGVECVLRCRTCEELLEHTDALTEHIVYA